jgi:hypothetical protein
MTTALPALIFAVRRNPYDAVARSALADLLQANPECLAAALEALTQPPDVSAGGVSGEELTAWERLSGEASGSTWYARDSIRNPEDWTDRNGNLCLDEEWNLIEWNIVIDDPGEGYVLLSGGAGHSDSEVQRDLDFIAASRQAVPRLCAAVRTLSARVAELEREVLDITIAEIADDEFEEPDPPAGDVEEEPPAPEIRVGRRWVVNGELLEVVDYQNGIVRTTSRSREGGYWDTSDGLFRLRARPPVVPEVGQWYTRDDDDRRWAVDGISDRFISLVRVYGGDPGRVTPDWFAAHCRPVDG